MKNKKSKVNKQHTWVGAARLLANISDERILQLSNDLSEGIRSGDVSEWRSVAKYFRDALDKAHNDINAIRPAVAAMLTGTSCVQHAHAEMDQWLKKVVS
jgi:hypothetical protein